MEQQDCNYYVVRHHRWDCGYSLVWVLLAGVGYLLVLPAVRDKDVVPHLHAEVQPGQGMTHSHPYWRDVAGYRCHGSHFLLPVVPSSTLWEAETEGSEEPGCEVKGEKKKKKEGWRSSEAHDWAERTARSPWTMKLLHPDRQPTEQDYQRALKSVS